MAKAKLPGTPSKQCGPSDDCNDPKKPGGAGGKVQKPKPKRKGHPPNMFILFCQETLKREGGNYFCNTRKCAFRWRRMTDEQKKKYKLMYCRLCKNCKSCKPKSSEKGKGKNGGGGAGKGSC